MYLGLLVRRVEKFPVSVKRGDLKAVVGETITDLTTQSLHYNAPDEKLGGTRPVGTATRGSRESALCACVLMNKVHSMFMS